MWTNIEEKGKRVGVLVVGDGASGKTCLLYRFVHKIFPNEYVPTVLDVTNSLEFSHRSCFIDFQLLDTAGGEDYDLIRVKSIYPLFSKQSFKCVLIVFSLVSLDSLLNVQSKWIPEIHSAFGNSVPIVLVGTKSDLKSHFKNNVYRYTKCVDLENVKEVCEDLNLHYFAECSSVTGVGIQNVFNMVSDAVFRPFFQDSILCRFFLL